jgi:hypothetical protein
MADCPELNSKVSYRIFWPIYSFMFFFLVHFLFFSPRSIPFWFNSLFFSFPFLLIDHFYYY